MPNGTPPQPVSRLEAFRYWLKLGFISFGGPAGQIALMHADLVDRQRWISERRFLHALNYCMLLPGPEATQLATYIGWLMHGTWGGIIAGGLFVLPGLLLLVALSWTYVALGSVPIVAGILYGMKPAVVAIVLAAAWRIGSRTLKSTWLLGLAVAAFVAIAILELPFPVIVVAAALAGLIGGRLAPESFSAGGAGPATSHADSTAIIDDDTPPPSHAAFSWRKFCAVAGGGIALGLLAWAALALVFGVQHAFTSMGWFFTKAALMTFGGAYAVLPYVYQGAVEHFHWLSPAQMIDGLALGETTPGPLIMIVAFVGFLGGWNTSLGGDIPLLAGVVGAFVAAFFTFLPSFMFILAGAPLVEATRDDLRLTAPLTAISAAVVGVIASLAIFFARHVFRLSLSFSDWDVAAMAISAAAAVALLRFRAGTIPVIAGCAAAGLVVSYLR